MRRAGSVCALLLLFGSAQGAEEALQIDVQGRTLLLSGPVREGDAARFGKAVGHQTFQRVVVNSPGGEVEDAIKIADYIHAKRLPVTVREICASSCANYWLAASPKVTVEPGGIIALHGNFRHAVQSSNLLVKLFARGMVRQEDDFFRRVGVDPGLSFLSGDYANQLQGYWAVSQRELNCSGYRVQGYTVPFPLPEPFKTSRQAAIKPELKCSF